MTPAAGIIITAPSGRILLLRRSTSGDHAGEWGYPGGKIEAGETAEEAAERETREEAGPIPYGQVRFLTRNVRDGVDFTTYTAKAEAEVKPRLDAESDAYTWADPNALPAPMHPGAEAAIRFLGMDESQIAAAMVSGDLSSPQFYANLALFDIRITGTGATYRDTEKEYAWRDPALYLNDAFLARCNGLPVILDHPKAKMLDGQEYKDRVIGAIMLPYIRNGEVWGIARINDEAAAAFMAANQLSTSPAVVLGSDGNETVEMQDGSPLLIEGKPALLDHIAICERGVWDQGGLPSGIATTGAVMAEAETAAGDRRADNDEPSMEDRMADAVSRIGDAVSAKLMDAIEKLGGRLDALEKGRRDAEAPGDGDAAGAAGLEEAEARKREEEDRRMAEARREEGGEADAARRDTARRDAEGEAERRKAAEEGARAERERAERDRAERDRADKARADAAQVSGLAKEVEALRSQLKALTTPLSEDEVNALARAQARADSLAGMFGQQAPIPMSGENTAAYRRRAAAAFQQYSERFKTMDLGGLPPAAFDSIEGAIYADAEAAARNPKVGQPGALIPIVSRDSAGRQITRYAGDPMSWMKTFMSGGTIMRIDRSLAPGSNNPMRAA